MGMCGEKCETQCRATCIFLLPPFCSNDIRITNSKRRTMPRRCRSHQSLHRTGPNKFKRRSTGLYKPQRLSVVLITACPGQSRLGKCSMLPTGTFDILVADEYAPCRISYRSVLVRAFRQSRLRLKDYKPYIESLSNLKNCANNQ